MRKFIMPLFLTSTLALGGCAYGLGDQDRYGERYGQRYGDRDGERYAADTCARHARGFGRVNISNVERRSRSTYRVRGIVHGRYDRRAFKCDVRDNGRIVDFDMNRVRY